MGDGMRETALIDLDTTDNSKDAVILRNCIRKPFQHKDTATFATRITICRRVKSFALTSGAQKMSTVKSEHHLKIEHYYASKEVRNRLTSGLEMTLTPPTMAAEQSPFMIARQP